MNLQEQLEAFCHFSCVPMHVHLTDAGLDFAWHMDVLEHYPPVEEALAQDEHTAVYTVSPEHIAFALVHLPGGYVFFGPSPSVGVGDDLVEEALRYIGQPLEEQIRFASELQQIPCRDLFRFRQLAAYLTLTAFDHTVCEWHYVDYPPPTPRSEVAPIAKPDTPEFDDFATANLLFDRKVMSAVTNGKPDELEKELSTMGLVFPIEPQDLLSKEDLHDKFVIALAEAAVAARQGGLGNKQIETMMAHYLALLRKAATFRDIVRLMKLMLMDFAVRTHQTQILQSSDPMTQRICRDIENHLHEKLTPSDMAGRLGISVPYLCTIFKRNTGKTVTAYVNERKIAESKYLLSQPGMTILKVATTLGYSSPNYFATIFKQVTGKTPTQWVNKE